MVVYGDVKNMFVSESSVDATFSGGLDSLFFKNISNTGDVSIQTGSFNVIRIDDCNGDGDMRLVDVKAGDVHISNCDANRFVLANSEIETISLDNFHIKELYSINTTIEKGAFEDSTISIEYEVENSNIGEMSGGFYKIDGLKMVSGQGEIANTY